MRPSERPRKEGMRLTTESMLEQMVASILGEFDGSTPDDGVEANMQSSWGQHFPGADKIADQVLAQGKGERPSGGGTVQMDQQR